MPRCLGLLAALSLVGCGSTPPRAGHSGVLDYAGDLSNLPPPEHVLPPPDGVELKRRSVGCPVEMVTVLEHGGGVVIVQDGHERVLPEASAVDELAALPAACDATSLIVYGIGAERASLERALAGHGRSFVYVDTGYREERLRYRIAHPTPELAGYDLARVPVPVDQVSVPVLDAELGMPASARKNELAVRTETRRRWREGRAYRGIAVRYRYTQGALQVLVPTAVPPPQQPGAWTHGDYGLSPALVLIPHSVLPVITEPDPDRTMQPLKPEPDIAISDRGNL